ncbi:MAG TPA: prepilin-type N-terminal cleavage/methylation domain-containing protein [Candidatus Sulfotelmatobacter sp.]|nr:prepilin-type N-terminal cleavage/methylation domain-containing protein [Candidatus Sulfotelmatobacter sp.]HWI55584.1 prepilin-type N-terminal cleavage/methylation domain-containing protein [Bacillota bacterium]
MNLTASTVSGGGPRFRPCQTGFTLLELLAVAVVLALLVSLLGTALARTQPNLAAVQCLNNLRQLGTAWRMYADDHQGRLVSNRDGANTGKAAGSENWVAGWLTVDYNQVNNSDNTNTLYLVDHEKTPYGAFLGPYLKTAAVFKCPADKTLVTIAGQKTQRVRSLSMNSFVGSNARTWTPGSRFSLLTNLAQIKAPANVFVFLEERPDGINDGCFFTNPDTRYNLIDYPAALHNTGGSFSFADGHAEIHRWKDARTIPPLVPGKPLVLNVTLPGNVDVDWLQQHASQAIW